MTNDGWEVPTWTGEDAKAAARQGWLVFTCEGGTHSPFEVQAFNEPENWIETFGFEPMDLDCDDDRAVGAMRAAFERGEEHAVKAWEFLRDNAPNEFGCFKMGEWRF